MERYRVTAGHGVGLPQRPTFYAHDPAPYPLKPPLTSREPCSFTAQLRPRAPAGDNHGRLRRLGEDTELSIFDAERYFNEPDDDEDVDVGPDDGRSLRNESAFGRPDPRRESCSLSSVDGGRRSRHGGLDYACATPTASSSEASWNSRSGLLTNPPGSLAVNARALPPNELPGKRRWLRRRKCPCSGKKAVEVREKKHSVPMSPSHSNFDSIGSVSLKKKDSSTSRTDQFAAALNELEMGSEWEMPKLKLAAGTWLHEHDLFGDPSPAKHFPPEVACHRIVRAGKPFQDGGGVAAFSFPVLVQATTAPGKPAGSAGALPDDPRRDSLDVFRPAEEAKLMPMSSAELQRRAVTAQMQTFPPRLDGGGPRREDDLASDASSDLFEIESLSTQATSCGVYRRRDSLDEPRRAAGGASGFPLPRRSSEELPAPSVAPSECYPPSEASVQWSVATAEGGFGPGSVANFSSAASDCDNAGFTAQLDNHAFSVAVAGGGGGRRRGGGLLSCRCEKAVSVGPSPVRIENERRPQFPPEEGGVKATARVRKGSSTKVPLPHLTKAAGAPAAGR